MGITAKFHTLVVCVAVATLISACRGAATSQPTLLDRGQAYVDQLPAALETPTAANVNPRNPLQSVDETVTTSKLSTTRPATTQPTTRPQKSELLAVPIPAYKPTFGFGICMILAYLFPLDKNDAESPPSTLGLLGMYTSNNSWATGIVSDLHVDEDRYRIKGGIFTGQMNYSFYGVGAAAGQQGISVPIEQKMAGAAIEPLFQIAPGAYLGPRYLYAHIKTSADIEDITPLPALGNALSELNTDSSAFGLQFEYDTRDSQFYPRHGVLFDTSVDVHDTAWGDSFNYQAYSAAYNQYFSLSRRQVIAVRGDIQDTEGNVPFYALNQIGRGPDLRGYRAGQFQNKILLAAQAEYRLELTDRLGVVAFGGVGEVAPNYGQLNLKELLPSLGAGLRFTISKVNHVNLRLDGAWGREGWQGYLSIGEAF